MRLHAPALAVLLICSFLTVLAFLFERDQTNQRAALHASADATQFQRTLQQGVDSYIHLNRALAAHFTASPAATGARGAHAFAVYMQSADILREHPGLSYLGYIRPTPRGPAHAPAAPAAPDPSFTYPYLYAYPDDDRARQARGFDMSTIPERWAAMQLARDSGETTATAKHIYRGGTARVPVVLMFTPIYDETLPAQTVAQRRVALRGFVFSIYRIEEMIERVMGKNFHNLFDLEVYDGSVHSENVLYDGDLRPHVLMHDVDMPIARQAQVAIAGRTWQLFFFPKPIYVERYRSWYGVSILAFGFSMSAALALLMWFWTRHLVRRSAHRTGVLHFDAVFEDHPAAVYALDLNRRFTSANAQALKEFKLSKSELIGQSVEQFIVPEKKSNAKARFEDTLGGNAVSYDSAIIDGDGARIEMSVIMIPVKAGSEVVSVLGIAQNVTAQKLAVRRLQDSRKMLQLVIDHIPQRVFWKDTNFVFMGCNEAAARDAGLTHPDQIVGRTDFDLAWRDSAPLYRKDDIETMSTGVAKVNFEEPQRRDDGSASWLRTSKIPLTDIDGKNVALLGLYEDITDRKNMENQLRELAHYDGLTGLVNRTFFHQLLERAVADSRRSHKELALLYFDIDHFKSVNDSYGHETGDALLKAFAGRVNATRRQSDVFARLGGDEFVLLVDDLPNRAAAERVAAKLVEAIQAPFELDGRRIAVSTSIGLAFCEPATRPDALIQHADHAMYEAKRDGRNRYAIAPPTQSAMPLLNISSDA